MDFIFDSKNINYKKPFGAVKAGEEITLYAKAKDGVYIKSLRVVFERDGEGEYAFDMKFCGKDFEYSCFQGVATLERGLYFYHFVADTEIGELNIFSKEDTVWQLSVYDKDFVPNTRQNGGIIYHIFVDRFNRGTDKKAIFNKNGVLKDWDESITVVDSDGVYRANDFYGGNLQGIIDKLDYLKSLNVSMIYLSPIFKSSSNHRYDIGDYEKIDELLGDEKKFKELIDKADALGMDIILDGVFNHTGSDSKYFNRFGNYNTIGACQSKESKYYDWYNFINYPDEYECWWGVTVTPSVNENNKTYREFILGKKGVLKKWTRLGVKGWRLDVVDELPEDFVEAIRKCVHEVKPEALIIGEVWEDASNKVSYGKRRHYLLGKELDGVMNYPFREGILTYAMGGSAIDFYNKINVIVENYPKSHLLNSMVLIGSHDTVRSITYLSGHNADGLSKLDKINLRLNEEEYNLALKRQKIASTLQYMLPGMPSVYYGDEIAMEGYEDPLNRMPMQWDKMNKDLLMHYRSLGNIRTVYKDAMIGDTIFERYSNGLLVMNRVSDTKSLRIVANTTGNSAYFTLEKPCIELLSNMEFSGQVYIKNNEVYVFDVSK